MFDRTVDLYHVSPISNMASIRSLGLCPDFASGRRAVVWLCTPSLLSHVVDHVVRVHGTSDLVIYRVRVRRSWLYRPGGWVRRGVWCCRERVDTSRLRPVVYMLPPMLPVREGEGE